MERAGLPLPPPGIRLGQRGQFDVWQSRQQREVYQLCDAATANESDTKFRHKNFNKLPLPVYQSRSYLSAARRRGSAFLASSRISLNDCRPPGMQVHNMR